MGELTTYAEQLVTDLRAGNVKVTTDIRNAIPPIVLVVPVPKRDYNEGSFCGGYTAEWTLVCLAGGIGDLTDAKALEDMVDGVAAIVDIATAEPASYRVPNRANPAPAYVLKHHVTVT